MERSEIEQLVTMYEIEPFGRDLWVQKKVVKTEDIEKIKKNKQEILRYLYKDDEEEKTRLNVNRCWECGSLKILGGKYGKLPYTTYKKADGELTEYVREQFKAIPVNATLNQAPTAKDVIETENFTFKVVSHDYDGC